MNPASLEDLRAAYEACAADDYVAQAWEAGKLIEALEAEIAELRERAIASLIEMGGMSPVTAEFVRAENEQLAARITTYEGQLKRQFENNEREAAALREQVRELEAELEADAEVNERNAEMARWHDKAREEADALRSVLTDTNRRWDAEVREQQELLAAADAEIEELKVQDIVSRNPGIDADEVRAFRKRYQAELAGETEHADS